MKNRKGFTLVEVIGAVIILGILAILAVPLFTKQLNTFRDDFYVNMVNTIKNSGREFFSDNRMYRPNGYLEASKVSLKTLNGQKYLDEFIDYEGSECDEESYVIVIRKGKDVYDYHVCLKCPNDDYDTTVGNKYCDSSWFDTTRLGYTLGDVEDIYVYKGTDKKVLEEKTKIPVWIVKYDTGGNQIEAIDGTGTENIPVISPVNLDVVDTNKEGEYTIKYKYDTTDGTGNPTSVEKEAKVIVYENGVPNISITKTNVVKTSNSASETKTTAFNNGDWAQKITITFGRGTGKYSETATSASKYQWKRGNKWVDVCTPTSGDNCTIQITEEMNETIYFRTVDSNGNIGKTSSAYNIKIDSTPPTATIYVTRGTMGNNNYYKSATVELGLKDINDVVGTDPDALSGIKYYTIDMSQIPARTVTSDNHGKITGTQSADTNSVTWYVFVEDNAQNAAIYSVTFKKDSTAPYATWNPSSTNHDNSDGITVNVVCKDDTSGPIANSKTQNIASPTSSSGVKISITCEDKAGNTATLSQTYKVRKHYSNNCSKCGEETCTSSSCCGTHRCNCSTSCDTCHRCAHNDNGYSCSDFVAYDCDCVTTCQSCASTCTSECCGCQSCWAYS